MHRAPLQAAPAQETEAPPPTVGQRVSLERLRKQILKDMLKGTRKGNSLGFQQARHDQMVQISHLLARPCPPMGEILRMAAAQPGLPGI